MLLSRGVNFLKTASQISRQNNVVVNLKQVRNKWCYRTVPERDIKWEIASEIFAGLAWWWILYSFWHHGDHFLGEFEHPVPSDWTDEELGIPPEDEL